jgi:hypothetical protein
MHSFVPVYNADFEASLLFDQIHIDRDGIASTRDPEDLVGQGIAKWNAVTSAHEDAQVKLEGRGLFGRFVTTRTLS